MSNSPIADYEDQEQPRTYHVGTLTYTRPALTILFFWLLWGDFCYTLMESVTGPIMLLKFDHLGASNTEMGVILGTIPAIVYAVLNPVISFRSDRHRSRLGRRIPFILFTLPFLVMALVGLAFGEHIGFKLHYLLGPSAYRLTHWLDVRGWHYMAGVRVSPNRAALWTIGGLLIAFTFFNSFVTSVFWYLFNDVVPEPLLARFMSWFRVIGLLSTGVYQLFIFPYSGTHSTEIFLGAAVLYLLGFGLMCFNVREGMYPPAPPLINGATGILASIITYAKECHSHKHWWYQWTSSYIGSIGGGIGAFTIFFYTKGIGLNMTQLGRINFTTTYVTAGLVLGSGWLADRYHPIRVVLIGVLFQVLVVSPVGLIWLFWHPSSNVAFWALIAMGVFLVAPAAALIGMWDPPLFMRFFPRDRYGQFCSTNAIWRSGGSILGGLVAGGFLDIVSHWVGKERAYLFIPVWQLVFTIPGVFLFILMYRSWKHHGGDENYIPPVPGNILPAGVEMVGSPV